MKLIQEATSHWNSFSFRIDNINNTKLKYKYSKYNYAREKENGVIVINFASDAISYFSHKEYDILKRADNKISTEITKLAVENGFWVISEEVEHAKLVEKRLANTYKKNNEYRFTILPTQKCNANCFYCFSQKDVQMHMSMETAESVANFILDTVNTDAIINLSWFGGEPLLKTDIIDYIIGRLSVNSNIKYRSSITTNGSLINKEIINKFLNEWNVYRVIIPIDGNRLEHNIRKAYYNKTTDAYEHILKIIPILLGKGIEVVCGLNFDRDNFETLPEVLSDLSVFSNHSLFYLRPNALFSPEELITKENEVNVLENDYNDKIAKFIEWADQYGFYKSIELILPKRYDAGCSMTEPSNFVIGADGSLLRCLRKFKKNGNTIGNCQQGIVYNSEYYESLMSIIPNEECLDCTYFPICQGGCKLRRDIALERDTPCNRATRSIDAILDYIHQKNLC